MITQKIKKECSIEKNWYKKQSVKYVTFGLQSIIQSKGSPITLMPPVGVLLYTHDWAIKSNSFSSAIQAPETPDLGWDDLHIVTPIK